MIPALLAAGCAAPPVALAEAASAVATPDGWALLEAGDDPLASHRPPGAACPAAAWGEEDGVFEIQTGVCSYFAATQPLAGALRPGDRLETAVWQAGLDAAPATAHVALLLGDRVVWERSVPIPAEPDLYAVSAEIDEAWPAGAPIGLHLHNHGFNDWSVDAIWRIR